VPNYVLSSPLLIGTTLFFFRKIHFLEFRELQSSGFSVLQADYFTCRIHAVAGKLKGGNVFTLINSDFSYQTVPLHNSVTTRFDSALEYISVSELTSKTTRHFPNTNFPPIETPTRHPS